MVTDTDDSNIDPNGVFVNIYGSEAKADTFLYLREDLEVEELDVQLRAVLGRLRHVMHLELTPTRILVQADVVQVMSQVVAKGYYLQFPPPQDDPGTPARKVG